MPGCVAACVCSVLGAQGPSLARDPACVRARTHCVLADGVCLAGARVLAVCAVVCAVLLLMLIRVVILSSSG